MAETVNQAFSRGYDAGREIERNQARKTTSAHKPGEMHDYRIECETCGQRGQVVLSVEPQHADTAGETAT